MDNSLNLLPLLIEQEEDELRAMVVSAFDTALDAWRRAQGESLTETIEYATPVSTPVWSPEQDMRLLTLFSAFSGTDHEGNPKQKDIGDARLNASTIHCLLSDATGAPSTQCGKWLNDEIINAFTILILQRTKRDDIFFVNSQTIAIFDSMANRLGVYADPQHRMTSVTRLAKRVGTQPRTGTTNTMQTARYVLAPCHVEENHWILVVVDRKLRNAKFADSLHRINGPETGNRACETVAFLVMIAEKMMEGDVDLTPIEILGSERDYPQQENGSDCGLFVCLGVQAAATGIRPTIDARSNDIWRKSIALALLEINE